MQELITIREENNFFLRHVRLIAGENGRDQGGEQGGNGSISQR